MDEKFRSGIAARTRATLLLKKEVSFSEEVLYQVFYLNLSRACVTAGRKKDAIDAFKKGCDMTRETANCMRSCAAWE